MAAGTPRSQTPPLNIVERHRREEAIRACELSALLAPAALAYSLNFMARFAGQNSESEG
jgi:hypothetical protein